tara:strand:- start:1396 stop:1641 length:246 start_codon:yes stop_codon:yes gene_type:complete
MTQNRPVGPKLLNWTPPPAPDGMPLIGRYARLERLDADRHAAAKAMAAPAKIAVLIALLEYIESMKASIMIAIVAPISSAM